MIDPPVTMKPVDAHGVAGSRAPTDRRLAGEPEQVAATAPAGSSADEISRIWSRGVVLPPYSPVRRLPEWEPHGRWMQDRPQLNWPDALVSARFAPQLLRGLLAVSVLVGQITSGRSVPRHLIGLGLALLLWGWLEWWLRWDLSSLHRRLLVVAGNWCLTAALIVFSPLAGIFAWSGYVIAGTFFTGWLMLLAVPISCVLMTATQFGGFEAIPTNWTLFGALMALNISIGLAAITLSNRREEAVLRRAAVTSELLATQHENTTLQRHIIEQARYQGTLDERARLARELHDTVAQGLVAIVTQLEAINESELSASSLRRRVDSAKDLARQSLGEARRAVDALQPPALDDQSLPAAVTALVGSWSQLNDVDARLRVSGDPRSTDQDAVLVRVCQEALANIARHAKASQVVLTLTYLEDEILLDIRDDGTGFDPVAVPCSSAGGGHGLPGMAERVRLAGGKLTVESDPAGGCVVSAAVPG
ncbi:MAG: sensor histidine kinase [Nakamurella sp.]